MDQKPPEQCHSAESDLLSAEVRAYLRDDSHAVIAMTSGGCARYAFSMSVDFCLDRKGYPLIHYASDNAHHHLIVTNSSMDFRFVLEQAADGMEMKLAVLTGMLELVDPGDHDTIDRYARYFEDVNVENYSRGNERLYRFVPSQVHVEWIDGSRVALPCAQAIEANAWRPAEETQLVEIGNSALSRTGNQRVAGVDTYGVDLIADDSITRLLFDEPTQDLAYALSAVRSVLSNERAVSP